MHFKLLFQNSVYVLKTSTLPDKDTTGIDLLPYRDSCEFSQSLLDREHTRTMYKIVKIFSLCILI